MGRDSDINEPHPDHTPPPPQKPPHEHAQYARIRNALLGAAIVGGGVWATEHHEPPSAMAKKKIPLHGKTDESIHTITKNYKVPTKEKQFFVQHKNGEFTEKERRERTKFLPHGEEILEDNGMLFYRVHPHNTKQSIAARLEAYPEYAFLKDQTQKTQSLNIPAKDIARVTWLPLPHENEDRHLSDEQFVLAAQEAIDELKTDNRYAPFIKKILARPGMTDHILLASMLGIAKKESGGAPLGSLEVFRWEGHGSHHEFSFSNFHVLQMGPGLAARRELNMTEGQTYHPLNATKLFLVFLLKKNKESKIDVTNCFPFTPARLETYATFYNGAGWRKHNATYPTDIWKYYQEALPQIADMLHAQKPELKIFLTPALPLGTYQYEKVGHDTETNYAFVHVQQNEALWHAIGRADGGNATQLLSHDACQKAEQFLKNYLQMKYHHHTYFPEDQIGVMQQDGHTFVVFQRGAERAKILVKK